MNVLLTSAGRRGLLVKILCRELETLDADAKVFATDLDPALSSACRLADGAFQVPRVSAPEYLDILLEICHSNQIGLVIPTIDPELLVLAGAKKRFAESGVQLVVSEPDLVTVCRDKRKTHSFFTERGLSVAATRDPEIAENYPLFAKPYDGSCGINTHILRTKDDLTPSILLDPKLMFLEYLEPKDHQEFTVDMYFDKAGTLRCMVPRERLETRAGEVSKARTGLPPELEMLKSGFSHISSARGCLTVQVFLNRKSGRLYGIEINPRFGGGYPLADAAGATYVNWLLKEYFQDKSIPDYEDWERNLTMLRYDDHVLVRD